MKGQLVHARPSRTPVPVLETLDQILALDHEGLPFESAYSQTMGHLIAGGIIRAHLLEVLGPDGERQTVTGFWSEPAGTALASWTLEAGSRPLSGGGESLRWQVRRGPRFEEASRVVIPTVLKLLGMKWAQEAHNRDGGLETDATSLAALYQILRRLDPVAPAAQLAEEVVRGLHPYVGFDAAGIAVLDGRSSNLVTLACARHRPERMTQFVNSIQEGLRGRCPVESSSFRNLTPLADDRDLPDDDLDSRQEYPLLTATGKLTGLLVVARPAAAPFTARERRLLEVLADHLDRLLETRDRLQELERQAKTDGMTDLYNYRTFRSLLSQEFSRSRRHGKPLSLILVDVDNFKQINDTLGHQKGDEALRRLARLMMTSKRKEDIVARYGGEEFVVVLPEATPEGALRLAERLRQAVETARLLDERPVTISIGVATLDPASELDDEGLIYQADQALGRAKRRGRNRVEPATPDLRLVPDMPLAAPIGG